MSSISIVTPSYNYAPYIPWCVESVLRSCGDRLREHIVIDDNSADESLSVLRTVAHSRLRLTSHYINRGLSSTLVEGIRQSTGDWVGWLNADDFYLPGALSSALERMERRGRSPDVVYGDTVFVDSEGTALRLVPQHPYSEHVMRHYGPFFHTCSALVRGSLIRSVAQDKGLSLLVDQDLWLGLSHVGATFEYHPKVFGAYRRHHGQLSNAARASEESERRRIREDYDFETTKMSRSMATVEHALRKALTGGYRRQLKFASVWSGHSMSPSTVEG